MAYSKLSPAQVNQLCFIRHSFSSSSPLYILLGILVSNWDIKVWDTKGDEEIWEKGESRLTQRQCENTECAIRDVCHSIPCETAPQVLTALRQCMLNCCSRDRTRKGVNFTGSQVGWLFVCLTLSFKKKVCFRQQKMLGNIFHQHSSQH